MGTTTRRWTMLLATAAMVACGTSETGNDGGSGGSGGSGGEAGGGGTGGSGGHGGTGGSGGLGPAECPTWTPEPFPADLGKGCASGSNVSLCLMDPTDSCETGLCLYHAADPTGNRGHCTVACTTGDDASCPAGYACQVDGCDESPICVRTERPGPSPVTVRESNSVLFVSTHETRTTDGSTWWTDAHADFVYERKADGGWVQHDLSTFGQRQGMLGVGRDVFVITSVGEPPSSGRIYRLREGVQAEVPTDAPIGSFFVDDEGRLVVSDTSGDHALADDLTLEPLPARGAALEGCTITAPLATRGFVGTCAGQTVVGSDLSSVTALPGVELESVVGLAPDDVWGRIGDSLVHFDGERLQVEVVLPPSEEAPRIVPTGSGTAVVMARDAYVATRGAACWAPVFEERLLRSIPWRGERVVGIGPSQVAWVSEFSLYELNLSGD